MTQETGACPQTPQRTGALYEEVRFQDQPALFTSLRLFEMQKKLEAKAQTDNERALTAELLRDMEQISRQAHEAVGFTYIPLEQLAALQ